MRIMRSRPLLVCPIEKTVPEQYEFQRIIAGAGGLSTGGLLLRLRIFFSEVAVVVDADVAQTTPLLGGSRAEGAKCGTILVARELLLQRGLLLGRGRGGWARPGDGPSVTVPKLCSGPLLEPLRETRRNLLLVGFGELPAKILSHHLHSGLKEVQGGAEAAGSESVVHLRFPVCGTIIHRRLIEKRFSSMDERLGAACSRL